MDLSISLILGTEIEGEGGFHAGSFLLLGDNLNYLVFQDTTSKLIIQ